MKEDRFDEDDNDIDALLTQQKEKKQEQGFADMPIVIPITAGAREKARLLGPLVAEEAGSPHEWYGFTLAMIGDEQAMIRDVLLADKQKIEPGFVSVKGQDVANSSVEIKKRNKQRGESNQIVGWIHNHADFATTPSHTDENNHLSVLNSVSLNTERSRRIPLRLIETGIETIIEGDSVVMRGQNAEDAQLSYKLREDAIDALLRKYNIPCDDPNQREFALNLLRDLLAASELQTTEARIMGFCYSIVVNNKGDEPHGEIITIEENAITGKKQCKVRKAPLNILEVEGDIKPDKDELVKEIKSRISFPPKLTRWLSNWIFGQEDYSGGYGYGDGYSYDTGYGTTYHAPGTRHAKKGKGKNGSRVFTPTASQGSQGIFRPIWDIREKTSIDDAVEDKKDEKAEEVARDPEQTMKGDFVKALFEYAQPDPDKTTYDYETRGWKPADLGNDYCYWTRVMMKNVKFSQSLEEACLGTGPIKPNEKLKSAYFPFAYDLREIAAKLCSYSYTEDEKKFMTDFTKATALKDKSKVLEEYVTGIHDARKEEEQADIDALLTDGPKEPKDMRKD